MNQAPSVKAKTTKGRIRKAYWTTFQVVFSYWRLSLISKIRGQKYYEKQLQKLHLKNAHRVKNAILELEGLFIKVGQLLSILTNFLPEVYHEPLQSLQDQLPPRPFIDIETRIETELGQPIDTLFSFFDKTPLATASIGQAHRACLLDGTPVVVKVQHLNIESTAEVDLKIIEKLVKLSSYYFDIKGIEYAYVQIRQMIEEELDFSQEMSSMITIGKNLENTPKVVIPKAHTAYCTRRILVTSFCEGVKISNIPQIEAWNIDKTDLTKRLINVYCKMVLEDGFYHADPHPGNILVQADGTLVFLDFGAVAQVQDALKIGIPQMIEAVAKNDTAATIEALRAMDFIANSEEATRFAEKIIKASRHFIENDIQMKGMDLSKIKDLNPFQNSLVDLTADIGLKSMVNTVQVPKDFVLLNRTATLLLGIASSLDNTLNPLVVVRPFMQKLILAQKGDLTNRVVNALQSSLMSLVTLPDEMNSAFKTINNGQLTVKVVGNNERTLLLYALGQQLVFVLLLVAAVVLGYLFRQAGDAELAKYSFIASGVLAFLLWRAMRRANKIKRLL